MRVAILAALLLALGAVGDARADVEFTRVAPAARSFRVGALNLTSLHDSQIVVANDGKTFGVGVSTSAVGNVLRAAGVPTDRITLSANALLVRTGQHLVLIDTSAAAESQAQLLFGLSEDPAPLRAEIPAGPIDVEAQHRHGGAERLGLAAPAGFGRPLE